MPYTYHPGASLQQLKKLFLAQVKEQHRIIENKTNKSKLSLRPSTQQKAKIPAGLPKLEDEIKRLENAATTIINKQDWAEIVTLLTKEVEPGNTKATPDRGINTAFTYSTDEILEPDDSVTAENTNPIQTEKFSCDANCFMCCPQPTESEYPIKKPPLEFSGNDKRNGRGISSLLTTSPSDRDSSPDNIAADLRELPGHKRLRGPDDSSIQDPPPKKQTLTAAAEAYGFWKLSNCHPTEQPPFTCK